MRSQSTAFEMNKQKHATLRVPEGSPIAGDFDDDTDDEAQARRTRRRVAGWTPDGATKAETGTATRTTDTGNIMMIIRSSSTSPRGRRPPEGSSTTSRPHGSIDSTTRGTGA
jgi:hypothetical protein